MPWVGDFSVSDVALRASPLSTLSPLSYVFVMYYNGAVVVVVVFACVVYVYKSSGRSFALSLILEAGALQDLWRPTPFPSVHPSIPPLFCCTTYSTQLCVYVCPLLLLLQTLPPPQLPPPSSPPPPLLVAVTLMQMQLTR